MWGFRFRPGTDIKLQGLSKKLKDETGRGWGWYSSSYKQSHSFLLSFPLSMSSSATESMYVRDDSGIFHCQYCPKTSVKQNTMYYHVQTKHIQEYRFTCEHCDNKKFVQKCAYLQHMANAHPEHAAKTADGMENPYVSASFTCLSPDCKHTAKTKANMIVHFARTHCKDWIPAFAKDTPCKGCEKVFASSTAYLYHSVQCIKPIPEKYAALFASGSAALDQAKK
jgi:hypothetical protein